MAASPLAYAAIAPAVKQSLVEAFGPEVIVETKRAPGDQLGDKVFVLVVGSRFNGKTDRQRQKAVWDVIRGNLASDQEARVALALVRGTEDVW